MAGTIGQAEMIRKNPLGTWEVRASSVPMTPHGISIPSWLGLVNLYKRSANDEQGRDQESKLSLTGSESYQKLIWGHICSSFKNPEIRLAALFALRYPRSFRTINDSALLSSYTRSSVQAMKTILKRENMTSILVSTDFLGAKDTLLPISKIDSTHYFNIVNVAKGLGENIKDFPEIRKALSALIEKADLNSDDDREMVVRIVEALGENLNKIIDTKILISLRKRLESSGLNDSYISLLFQLALISR